MATPEPEKGSLLLIRSRSRVALRATESLGRNTTSFRFQRCGLLAAKAQSLFRSLSLSLSCLNLGPRADLELNDVYRLPLNNYLLMLVGVNFRAQKFGVVPQGASPRRNVAM